MPSRPRRSRRVGRRPACSASGRARSSRPAELDRARRASASPPGTSVAGETSIASATCRLERERRGARAVQCRSPPAPRRPRRRRPARPRPPRPAAPPRARCRRRAGCRARLRAAGRSGARSERRPRRRRRRPAPVAPLLRGSFAPMSRCRSVSSSLAAVAHLLRVEPLARDRSRDAPVRASAARSAGRAALGADPADRR